MRLEAPLRMLLLVVPIALVVLAVLLRTRRSTAAVRFAHVDLLEHIAPRPSWRRLVPPILVVVGLVLLVVGLAQPVRDTAVEREVRTVVLAFDVSFSMQAQDVSPSRLDVARDAAQEFLDAAPNDVRIGLVTFAGTVVRVVDPTTNHQSLIAELDAIELRPSTAIGDAIITSLGLLPPSTEDGPGGSIVVLSDGATIEGTSNDVAVEEAVAQGVPISTISVGTPGGTITDVDGTVIEVPSFPEALAAIAEATGGTATDADNADAVYAIFDSLGEALEPEYVTEQLDEWFMAAAFVFIAAAAFAAWWFHGRLV